MQPHSFIFLTFALLSAQFAEAQNGKAPVGWTGKASFRQFGTTGVGAMMVQVTTDDKIHILDRVQENPLRQKSKGRNTPYWGAEFSIGQSKVTRGLAMQTNSFCAAGGFLGDGRLASAGGDGYRGNGDFAQDGLQAIRLFTPCDDGKCQIYENPNLRMARPRWYPAVARLSDGSLFVAGGVSETAHMTDEPTIEFYPANGRKLRYSNFLHNALPWNLFAHAMAIPHATDELIFMAAGNNAQIYNWKTNTERLLPNLPNSIQVNYPFGASGALLPLTYENNYTPSILLCGGTPAKAGDHITPQTPSTNICARMELTEAGIRGGWQVENMPENRMMGDFVLTPDGKVIIINGAKTGSAGFYNQDQRQAKTGWSSADNPALTPYAYDPAAPRGSRWFSLGTRSKIPRMYHSVATLIPDGRIFVAGSNPNPNVNYQQPYPTEYRVEYLTLPNTAGPRPSFSGMPSRIRYGRAFSMNIKLPAGSDTSKVSAVLVHLPFSTHGINYNMRNVKVPATVSRNGQSITITPPPNARVMSPGPAWLYIINNGVPSVGRKLMLN